MGAALHVAATIPFSAYMAMAFVAVGFGLVVNEASKDRTYVNDAVGTDDHRRRMTALRRASGRR